VVLVTETKELLNMYLAYSLRGERMAVGDKSKKRFQISSVGGNGISC